jgi:hypothetical protein
MVDMDVNQLRRERGQPPLKERQKASQTEGYFAAITGQPPKKMSRKFKGKRDASKYGKRHKPGVMNGTEEAYAELLQARTVAGDVIGWWFEAMTFKLADDTRYTPDFVVLLEDGSIECIDAKGGGPIDPKSLVKIKCAAEKFYQFKFVIEQKQAKKHGGNWKRTEF